jgi:hypothetical protein
MKSHLSTLAASALWSAFFLAWRVIAAPEAEPNRADTMLDR